MPNSPSSEERFDVAVIGMAARFPGAPSTEHYWQNLTAGVESIHRYNERELLALHVDAGRIRSDRFVPAGSSIAGRDMFAASFFGYSPREAELMDPQHRLFLECCWEAFENAGYAPRRLPANTGVFAGAGLSAYLLFNLMQTAGVRQGEEEFQAMIGADKDFLSTRVSYKLNLKGPSLSVQSGCSTSLVAVHLAVQHLLSLQCDLAIAGGASVGVPQRTGYEYEPGGLLSPDGRCRAFDADAAGTVFGEGVGAVVLKRLEDAVYDRDHICAVIRGSAINNDGAAKIGYTAPSVDGQAEVISRALALAGVDAGSIGYVETHGTATKLGDPVEVTALTDAFRRTAQGERYCGIGSVKTNLGHLDAAAGIAGLIKAVLMIEHGQLVPSLHFNSPNPRIDFDGSPFYVVTKTMPWEHKGVRRAGVSSFGIGGTNAHVVLEEAPEYVATPSPRPVQILSVSAMSPEALEQASLNAAAALSRSPDSALADMAWTLHTGREAFSYRRSVVCGDCRGAGDVFFGRLPGRLTDTARVGTRAAFLFPGGGTQYAGMGQGIYETEAEFRRHIDYCADLLKPQLGYDLKTAMYPSPERAAALERTSAGLPAVFVTEYALAKLLLSWGIQPAAMLGHSLGEYTAACIAGVFSVESALELVACRGRLLETLPRGSMIGVYVSEAEARELAGDELAIAAVNGPEQCVISGPAPAVERLIRSLEARHIEFRRLHIDAAAHSPLVDPVLDQFRAVVRRIRLAEPTVPFLSNETGTWIRSGQATDPEYWIRHLRHTVRFSDCLDTLLEREDLMLVEAGPSHTLTTLLRGRGDAHRVRSTACMRHPHDSSSDISLLYTAVARMWNAGIDLDWAAFYERESRRRVPLPSYPFERERYWIEPSPGLYPSAEAPRSAGVERDPHLYRPGWEWAGPAMSGDQQAPGSGCWFVLCDEHGVGEQLASMLGANDQRVISVRAGHDSAEESLAAMFADAGAATGDLFVIDLSNLDATIVRDPAVRMARMARILTTLNDGTIRILAVADGIAQVAGNDTMRPENASLIAACTVISQEHNRLDCRLVDVCVPASRELARQLAVRLFEEAHADDGELVIALRGPQRWRRVYRKAEPEPCVVRPSVREGGVYLLTGGAGKLGRLIAHDFARRASCKLILTGRPDSPNPFREEMTRKLAKEIAATGSEIHWRAVDVTDLASMQGLIAEIYGRFGRLDGALHLAGITGVDSLSLIQDLSEEEYRRQFTVKADGCSALGKVLDGRELDFCALFSSTAAILGGPGLMPYAAACCFLDAFALSPQRSAAPQGWISINWDGWLSDDNTIAGQTSALDDYALKQTQALNALHRILSGGLAGQYLVTAGTIDARIERWTRPARLAAIPSNGIAFHPRPELISEYAAPTTPLQRGIAAIWSEVLGLQRVGLDDNVFDLGGNSLIGLRIVSRMKSRLDFSIKVTTLFERPTIRALAALVDGAAPRALPVREDSRRRGESRRRKRLAASSS